MGSRTRRIPDTTLARIRDLLTARLDEDFGPRVDGARRVGQRQICERIGISQPVLHDIEAATGSLGVHALIALRNYLRKPIDELLGLEPLDAPADKLAEMQRTLDRFGETLRAMNHLSPDPPPKGPPDAPRPRRRS
jgi:transcriptional regulator with XRE-family HTH domain